jgi:phosphatidate cytidylyltransferase
MFYLPSPWFDIVLGLLAVAATVELLRMIDIQPRLVYGLVTMVVWSGMVFVQGSFIWLPMALMFLMISWLFILIVNIKEGDLEQSFRQLAYAQWMMFWLLLFIVVMMQLHAHEHGIAFIAGACAGVWATDIAAYFTGKACGSRKLCPVVSPGKTWEGTVGGVFAGIIIATVIWVFGVGLSWLFAVCLAVVLVGSAVLGDLAESLLKRAVGVKDSGNMLPGHGGLLDRIDALLPSIPISGLLWLMFA